MKIVGNTPGFHGDEFDDARKQTSLVPARHEGVLAIVWNIKLSNPKIDVDGEPTTWGPAQHKRRGVIVPYRCLPLFTFR
jgi:hypothetical protein